MEARVFLVLKWNVCAASLICVLFCSIGSASGETRGLDFDTLPIEDPSGHALDRFFKALQKTAQGEKGAITRIAHYGDSFIVGDQITRTIRSLFQKRYGDGGPGFILAGRPWNYYRRYGVKNGATSGWKTYRSISGGPADRIFGYGGVTFQTSQSRRRVWFNTSQNDQGVVKASSIDIHYLAQPNGGDLEVLVDDEHILTISTKAEDTHSAFHQVDVEDGPHKFTLRTAGGKIRLFGAALERNGPGVVYDSMGINGACATVLGRMNPQNMSEQFKHRRPDLIVIAFGANETNRPALVSRYEETLPPIIRQFKEASHGASCLIVGALDRGERLADGTIRTDQQVEQIVKAQRKAAQDVGCGFFDSYTAMGGNRSMSRWAKRGLGASDLIHPTSDGAELIAQGLFNSLEKAFRKATNQPEPQPEPEQ